MGENDKRTVVFFGAGGAGRAFRHHSGVVPDLYVDNSPTLQGTRVDGVPVRNPNALNGLENIVVYITSGFVDEIRQQLLNIGVSVSAIVEIPKSQMGMHPFATNASRESAAEELAGIIESIPVPESVLCVGGTALGFARNNDFIPWDFDIDLFCRKSSRDSLLGALESNLAWRSTEISELSVTGVIARADSFLEIPVGIVFFEDSRDYTDRYSSREWTWPSKCLMNPETVEVRGHVFYLPNPSHHYLSEVYGSDWQTERADFAYSDYGGSQAGR